MTIRKHIPNMITCLNLLFGCFSIVMAISGELTTAAYLIGVAAVLDFLDGMAARLLKVISGFGKELDSMADMVSFGVAPAILVFHILLSANQLPVVIIYGNINIIPFFAFMITLFSALRLARFNIDTRQKEDFLGLPVPANALFFASFPLIIKNYNDLCSCLQPFHYIFTNAYFYLSLTVVFSLLLVSNMPLFSLKVKNLKFKENSYRYFLLFLSLAMLIIFKFLAVPFIVIIYIILSLIKNSLKK